mmetsp:Transcript_13334/g.38339  ORF Transcript_13334/g.38339 Transcript_13334/m.38339 type:complete len:336 (-) Transcript_13334:1611-2618(-)
MELVGLHGEVVRLTPDAVRDRPTQRLHRAVLHRGGRPRPEEQARLQSHHRLGLHRGERDGHAGGSRGGERDGGGDVLLGRGAAHKPARSALHRGLRSEVDLRHLGGRDLHVAGIELQPGRLAIAASRRARLPSVREAGPELDHRVPRKRRLLLSDGAHKPDDVGLAVVDQMHRDVLRLGSRLRLVLVGKRCCQGVLAQDHLREREAQAPNLRREPWRRVLLPKHRQLHDCNRLAILGHDGDVRRGWLAFAVHDRRASGHAGAQSYWSRALDDLQQCDEDLRLGRVHERGLWDDARLEERDVVAVLDSAPVDLRSGLQVLPIGEDPHLELLLEADL